MSVYLYSPKYVVVYPTLYSLFGKNILVYFEVINLLESYADWWASKIIDFGSFIFDLHCFVDGYVISNSEYWLFAFQRCYLSSNSLLCVFNVCASCANS